MLYVLLQAHLLHSVSYKTILLFLNLCKNNKNLPAFNSWQKERRELVHHVYVSLQLKSQFRNTGRKILAFLYWHQRKRFVFRILIIELNSFMNLFHCSPHDFYWMHLFHISRNTSCTLPPRPLSRKNRITLLGITVVPREIQGKAKLMQNCGGGCNLRSAKCLQNGKKSMHKERTLLNLSTCVSHNTRMAWFVLCGLSSQSAFGRRGSLSVD